VSKSQLSVSEKGGLLKGFSGRHFKIKTKPSARTVYKKYGTYLVLHEGPRKNIYLVNIPLSFPHKLLLISIAITVKAGNFVIGV
jgi:hypothetical protein